MKNDREVGLVYLFYGPEDFLIQEEIQRLLDLTLSLRERSLNLHLFRGDEHSGQEIVQTAWTIPMFARYRFVLVREADRVDEEKIEALVKYIQSPSPTTCLVLSAEGLGPWKKHRAQIEKVGEVVECTRLRGKGLVTWLKNRIAGKGKTLSEDSADYLVEVVGDHLAHLENALEKVCLSVGEKRRIELSDIEGTLSDVKVSTVFDLTDAIGRQDVDKALQTLGKVLDSKTVLFKKDEDASKVSDPVPLLLSMMARQYRLIWKVKDMSTRRQGAGEMAKELKMSQWMVRSLLDQSKKFSEPSLREGVLKCHRTDLAIKKGRGPRELLMEKLVIDLCRPGMPGHG
jgi:DNA polymerase-3 subunit delta